jgi:uncharacterized repeat protein (TIGR01451 family)
MKKLALLLASVATFLFVTAVPVLALGQIEGGNIYRIINETRGSDWIDPNTADPGNTVIYRVRIHNPGPDCIQNVFVKATLPSGVNQTHTSLLTVKADNVTRNFVTDSATLNLSSAQRLNYQSGSTQLLDANRNVIRNLPEGILGDGVGIGNVCVSINERRYVQFKVRVSAPTPPAPVPTPAPQPQVKGEILPVTGPASVAGLLVGASALAGIGHYVFRRYLA